MRKTISYSSIIIASLLVTLVFVTSKTYAQLSIGVLLYPALIYFATKIFPSKAQKSQEVTVQSPTVTSITEPEAETETVETESGHVDVADIEKRAFLKVIGAAGISFFLYSLLNKKTNLFSGKAAATGTGVATLEDTSGNKINPAERQPMDGYQISEIDDNVIAYYGFTNKNGSWLIMREDTDMNSFRYCKGDSEFSNNWKNREQLQYDYFHNVV